MKHIFLHCLLILLVQEGLSQEKTADSVKQLKEVIIRGRKPLYQQRPEGITVNVESSILSKGSTALEILERSPGVILDRRNNSFSLNGKNGVLVMINGKLMRMPMEQLVNLLNGMSGNEIEKIELMTTPSAMYDAEGSAGIINIVMKKNRKRGTNGSFSVTGGYGWGEKASANINLSHNTEKVNLYGTYSFLHDRSYFTLDINSMEDLPSLGGKLHMLTWDTSQSIQDNHDITLGIDVKLHAKTTIGGSIFLNSSTRISDNYNREHMTIFPDSLLFHNGHIHGRNHWNNVIGSMYLTRIIREGEKINIDLDYLLYKNNYPSQVISNILNKEGTRAINNDSIFATNQRGFANTAIQVGVFKIDYTKQLNTKLKLETGIKGNYTESRSASGLESLVNGTWISRSQTSNNVVMKERIGAVYASVNIQADSLTNLVIGARYENAFTNMSDPLTKESLVKRRQGVIFPGISLTRKIDEHSELQLSWTKRISRPTYNDLASFVRYADPIAVFTGNPLLKPTITNNIKLGYSYRDLSFSLMFSSDKNPLAWNQLTENTQRNLLYVSPQNITWQNNITLQANLPFKLNDWWSMSYSIIGGWKHFKIDYTKQPLEYSYLVASLNFMQTFKLPGNFSTELSGWCSNGGYNGTVKVGSMGAVNMGIKKELKNNSGTVQLSVNDIFQTMRINVYFGAITEEAYSITNKVIFDGESRVFPVVRLTYTKSFSSGKSGSTREGNGAKEEQERVRKD